MLSFELCKKVNIKTSRGIITHIFKCTNEKSKEVAILINGDLRIYKLNDLGFNEVNEDLVNRDWNVWLDSRAISRPECLNVYVVMLTRMYDDYGFTKVEITDNNVNFVK